MCGITGIITPSPSKNIVRQINVMTDSIRHRGPDDEGYVLIDSENQVVLCSGDDTDKKMWLPHINTYFGEPCKLVFGFRRLSILDLSICGHQPMVSEDHRFSIILNGEIYNYLELRKELVDQGYSFFSNTDTEVLLKGFECWGKSVLNHLVGMFAFVIFDQQKNILFAARDFFGIKPFYYSLRNGQFAFASEIKALLTLPWVECYAEPQSVYDYLRYDLTNYDDATFFSSIKQLPAGHYVELDLNNLINDVQIYKYWELNLDNSINISRTEAAGHVQQMFLENIKIHLRSDVPVGVALSGGIDSSAITCGIRLLEPDLNMHSFSLVTDDPDTDEAFWIDEVLRHTRAISHKVTPEPSDLLQDLEDFLYSQEEPFGGLSIYGQFRVFKLVQKHGIKVTMDGQGGDELLAGYRFYLPFRLATMFREFRLKRAFNFMKVIGELPDVKDHQKNYLLRGLIASLPSGLEKPIRAIMNEHAENWLQREWFRAHGVKFTAQVNERAQADILRESLSNAISYSSLPKLLHQEDRNSMWFSVESRVPFLTPAFVKFILSLPESYIIDETGTSKSIFRDAMRGIVPDNVLDRRDKKGFATPEKLWLSGCDNWVEKTLSSEIARSIPGLSVEIMTNSWQDVIAGNVPYSKKVWRWINLIKWTEQYNVVYD